MHSLKTFIDTLAGESNIPVSVEQCIEALSSADSNELTKNKAEAHNILSSLITAINSAAEAGNSTVIHACLDFIASAANDDHWLKSVVKVTLKALVNVACHISTGTGFVSLQQLEWKSLPFEEKSDAFDSVIVSCNLTAHLFKIFLVFFDYESPQVKKELRRVHDLACLILFRQKHANREDYESELCYAIDCLDRNACFLISNAVEAFPETIESLHGAVKESGQCLLTLLKEASESCIQRSLTRMCSVLFNHRNASKRFKFSKFRDGIKRELLLIRFDSVDGLKLFQKIDLSFTEDDEEDAVQDIDAFCEAVKTAVNRDLFFVARSCSARVETKEFRNVANVEFDVSSFAVYLPDHEPIRVPWYALEKATWATSGTSIQIQCPKLPYKTLEIEFHSSAAVEGSVAWKVGVCLKKRISSKVGLNLGLRNASVKMSLPRSDVVATNAKAALENNKYEDGENVGLLDKVCDLISKRTAHTRRQTKEGDEDEDEDMMNEVASSSDTPDSGENEERHSVCSEDEGENEKHDWYYNGDSDSDVSKEMDKHLNRSSGKTKEGKFNGATEADEEGEFFSKLGRLIGKGLDIRKRETELLIEKSEARIKEMRLEHEKEEERETKMFLDELMKECDEENKRIARESRDILSKLEEGIGRGPRKNEGLGAKKRQLVGVVENMEKKMKKCTRELNRKVVVEYEKCVNEKKKTAEKVDELFQGLSDLMRE